ncbi:MAG TPA: peptidoglycan-binding domain-containing protein [Gaiellaceae bacterium]|nr:peptidoglycan-binding domain-containing protein [Gaiellaceae bacterium]
MEGREQRDPGYDDWFDEPEPPTETHSGAYRGVYDDGEDWVLPEDEVAGDRGQRQIVIAGRTLTTTQVAIIAVSVLALFFAILAAAGVFSTSKAAIPPVTTQTLPPPTTASTPATNTLPAAVAPAQTLSPGATGSQVKVLQRALTALGFSPGKADGDYGPSTQIAVEKFQAANNLATDGVVGQETLNALQKALSG